VLFGLLGLLAVGRSPATKAGQPAPQEVAS